MSQLSSEQINRYKRHLLLPEVGVEGQKKLLNAKVLCIGAGGLGCPISLYLAAAGVGTIGLADVDVVSPSNLQRQILFGTSVIGEPKVEAAAKRLKDLNPDLKLIPHKTIVNSENVMDLIKDYDIIVDGTDNFPTRYCVNDACVLQGKPNVYGSIFRFEGMVTVFAPHLKNPDTGARGPCYRCLYPEPPDPGSVRGCAGGRRARRDLRQHRLVAGDGSCEADSRHRSPRDRQAHHLVIAGHGIPHLQNPPRPQLPRVWRSSNDHQTDRLRTILRRADPRPQIARGNQTRSDAVQSTKAHAPGAEADNVCCLRLPVPAKLEIAPPK